MRRCLLVLGLAACGPAVSIYMRTAPRRVEVTKQASASELRLAARRIDADGVELVAKRASDVRVTSVLHYGAASVNLGPHGAPLIELFEIPMGLLMFAMLQWESPNIGNSTSTTKYTTRTNWILAMLNPFQRALWFRVDVDPVSSADVFVDPPIVRELQFQLPAPALAIAYRALDEGERVIGQGTTTTDAFGRAALPNLASAIALEVTAEHRTSVVWIVPAEPPPTTEPPPAAEPPPATEPPP